MLQLGFKGFEELRVTLAAEGGGEIERTAFAMTGELGVSYRTGPDPGFAVHLGVVPEFLIFNGALRYELLRHEMWVGGGARFAPTYGPGYFCQQ
jgi:hypothetical protein